MNYLGKKVLLIAKSILLCAIILTVSCENNNSTKTEIGVQNKITFTSEIPVDVDSTLQQQLISEGDIFALNQAFNRFSWQAFVAINWPVNELGEPDTSLTGKGKPQWLSWKEAFQVYRADGGIPAPWGAKRQRAGLSIDEKILAKSDHRIIQMINTPTSIHRNKIEETDQAFAGRLYDQNGNLVVYEVLMNEAEFDYVVENKLYNVNGQVDFYNTQGIANFPAGGSEVGAIEIKFAWKQLVEGDPLNHRYFQSMAFVINPETQMFDSVPKLMGMIGMHISQKTPTGKQWVWSTFEHIDNLDENLIENGNGGLRPIHPSLTDPNCEICPANIDFDNGKKFTYKQDEHGNYWAIQADSNKYYANSDVLKTQSKRMVDIPKRVQSINAEVQAYFKSINSIWQYYQLIDTQYPINQNVPPAQNSFADYQLPEAVTNKPGGKPNIALLTNISMETFFQAGNQDAANLIENNLGNKTSGYQIYGTESCMGCHSSAGIYMTNTSTAGQLSGDFSWLLGRAVIDSTLLLKSSK